MNKKTLFLEHTLFPELILGNYQANARQSVVLCEYRTRGASGLTDEYQLVQKVMNLGWELIV